MDGRVSAQQEAHISLGARNEKEGDDATRFYKFQTNRLVLIRSIPWPAP